MVDRCPRGHGSAVVGRTKDGHCRQCRREDDRARAARNRIKLKTGQTPSRFTPGEGYILDAKGWRWTQETTDTPGRLRAIASHMLETLDKDTYDLHRSFAVHAIGFLDEFDNDSRLFGRLFLSEGWGSWDVLWANRADPVKS